MDSGSDESDGGHLPEREGGIPGSRLEWSGAEDGQQESETGECEAIEERQKLVRMIG